MQETALAVEHVRESDDRVVAEFEEIQAGASVEDKGHIVD